ncbi:DUF2236 domain-containing protein [bacterium]|nr:DUF2236 domain-containing protein [bacterium]
MARSDSKGRFHHLREIESLDPERDHQRILHLLFGYEFPWDSVRALEVALYRTYAVPSISGLLDGTGEFFRHPQRRYDDTAILIAEMCRHGYETGRGKAALERIRWAHSHFPIANDDYLFVLSTFIREPIRWIDAFGWRKLCRNEHLAYYRFWRAVGERMGIRDIPPSLEAFGTWADGYEAEHLRYTETNRRIAIATRELFVAWFPRPFAPLVRTGVHALLDDGMLRAFGFPSPSRLTRRIVRGTLAARGRLVRWLPPRRRSHFFMEGRNRTHPDGYDIDRLGPPHLVAGRDDATRR